MTAIDYDKDGFPILPESLPLMKGVLLEELLTWSQSQREKHLRQKENGETMQVLLSSFAGGHAETFMRIAHYFKEGNIPQAGIYGGVMWEVIKTPALQQPYLHLANMLAKKGDLKAGDIYLALIDALQYMDTHLSNKPTREAVHGTAIAHHLGFIRNMLPPDVAEAALQGVKLDDVVRVDPGFDRGYYDSELLGLAIESENGSPLKNFAEASYRLAYVQPYEQPAPRDMLHLGTERDLLRKALQEDRSLIEQAMQVGKLYQRCAQPFGKLHAEMIYGVVTMLDQNNKEAWLELCEAVLKGPTGTNPDRIKWAELCFSKGK